MSGLLVLTAVDAERDAVRAAGDAATVVSVGVGPAEAGAGAARAIARHAPDLVLSAGIAGGWPPAGIGTLVVADPVVFADLGAQTADGFAAADELGFGRTRYPVAPGVVAGLARATGARPGPVLTVATVTGTAARADWLAERYPGLLAEAMEGAAVAAAAGAAGVPFGELRAISNTAGPRDRAAWRVGDALQSLTRAVAQVIAAPWAEWGS